MKYFLRKKLSWYVANSFLAIHSQCFTARNSMFVQLLDSFKKTVDLDDKSDDDCDP